MTKSNNSFHYATEALTQSYTDYTFGTIALFGFAVGKSLLIHQSLGNIFQFLINLWLPFNTEPMT